MNDELPFEVPGVEIDFSQISKESQVIKVYTELRFSRKGRRQVTIIEGLDPKDFDLEEIASVLKSKCATGGTVKDNKIILQGNHKNKVKEILINDFGFNEEQIKML